MLCYAFHKWIRSLIIILLLIKIHLLRKSAQEIESSFFRKAHNR